MTLPVGDSNLRPSGTQRRLARLGTPPVSTTPQDVAWLTLSGFGLLVMMSAPIGTGSRFLSYRDDFERTTGTSWRILFGLSFGLYLVALFVLLTGAGWSIMKGAWRRTTWGFSASAAHGAAAGIDGSSRSLGSIRTGLIVSCVLLIAVALALAYQLNGGSGFTLESL